MSSEIEVPMESVQQNIEHAAHGSHGDGHSTSSNWITWSALLSALLAVLAAVAALQAGHLVNEAMMEQISASNTWAYFQAKSIKGSILDTRRELLAGLGKTVPPELEAKQAEYAKDMKELKEKAEEKERESHSHFEKHAIFATAVTFYQIAIAVTAIAVLAKRRKFLLVAGGFGVVGLYFIVQGFLFHAH